MVIIHEIVESSEDAFEKVMNQVLTETEDQETREQLGIALKKMHKSPPLPQLELILGKTISLDDARRMIFYPDQDDMKLYPILLRPAPNGAPDSHPMKKVQIPFMSLFYLVHHNKWDLLSVFIAHGGLETLVANFVNENLYVRSQAIHAFYDVSVPDKYDWFEPPSLSSETDAMLRSSMRNLCDGPFLKNLIANFDPPFPGASYLCLQIMAFWLSWIRLFYTDNKELRLSGEILDTLKRWSERKDVSPEEHELATKVHEDFSRWPPLEDDKIETSIELSTPTGGESSTSGDVPTTAQQKDSSESTTLPPSQKEEEPSTPENEAEKAKTKGNEWFAKAEYQKAVDEYSRAIDLDSSQASYYANRAMAFIKLSTQAAVKTRPDPNLAHALADCEISMLLNPSYSKVYFRKAHVLLEMTRPSDAMTAWTQGAKVCKTIDQSAEQLRQKIQQALDAKNAPIPPATSEPREKPTIQSEKPPTMKREEPLQQQSTKPTSRAGFDYPAPPTHAEAEQEEEEEQESGSSRNFPSSHATPDIQALASLFEASSTSIPQRPSDDVEQTQQQHAGLPFSFAQAQYVRTREDPESTKAEKPNSDPIQTLLNKQNDSVGPKKATKIKIQEL